MRIRSGAEERCGNAITCNRIIAPAGAFVEPGGFEVGVRENRGGTAARIAERGLELRKRAIIVFARLQDAAVAIAGDRIVWIEQHRTVQRRVRRRQIVLFEPPPA